MSQTCHKQKSRHPLAPAHDSCGFALQSRASVGNENSKAKPLGERSGLARARDDSFHHRYRRREPIISHPLPGLLPTEAAIRKLRRLLDPPRNDFSALLIERQELAVRPPHQCRAGLVGVFREQIFDASANAVGAVAAVQTQRFIISARSTLTIPRALRPAVK
jgi:hypothetical protein